MDENREEAGGKASAWLALPRALEPEREELDPAELTAQGWASFQTKRLEIWLPDGFVGGDPTRDRASLMAQAEALEKTSGHRWRRAMKRMIRQRGRKAVFVSLDTRFPEKPATLSLALDRLPLLRRGLSLEDFVRTAMGRLKGLRVLQEEAVPPLRGDPARRVLVADEAAELAFLAYVLRHKNGVWSLNAGTALERAPTDLPVFQRCFRSLRIPS